jgi:MFS transporter, DHA3 family, macrolide efflux protein
MNPARRSYITFYTLLLTQTLSLIGSQMTALALGIWVYETTGNASPLALVAFFTFLPRLLSVSFAGVIADRYDRRYVMALADAGQAIGTIVLLAVLVTGVFELWHLYLVAVIQAIFGVFQQPAFQASVTMLIPDNQRDRANAFQLLTGPVAGIIAPTFAAVTYAAVGVSGVIVIDLVTFLVGAVVVLMMDIPKPQKSKVADEIGASFWAQASAGLRYVWSRKPLFFIFVFMGCTNFFMAGIMVLRTPYLLARTGNSEVALGILMSVASVGSLIGTLLMGTWGGFRPRINNIVPTVGFSGLMMAWLGTLDDARIMAVPIFVMALFPSMINVSLISILQIKVPPDLQGRVFAAIQQMSMTLMPLSYLLVGPIADRVAEPAARPGWMFESLVGGGTGAGMGLMHVISGMILACIALAFYVQPLIRNLETLLPDYTLQVAVEEA